MIDYIKHIQMAIDFIEEHIDDQISVEDVASSASFSEYHFHRIFTAVLGESVSEYIRKRRLAQAGRELIGSALPVIEVGLNAGYDSQEAFTRAFKKMFGVTPAFYRRRGKSSSYIDKQKTTLEMIEHLQRGLTMEPRIETKDCQLVVGMAGSFGENAFHDIGKLWDRFNERQSEIDANVIDGDYALGVCCASHPQIAKGEGHTFIYMACRPVSSIGNIPEGMVAYKIPAARYAVFTHSGPLKNLPHTINYIWGTWLPKSEHGHADGPDFELYDDRFDAAASYGDIDIFVPIG